MEITTVVFDFDGTIMDTTPVILQSWQYAYRCLRGYEAPEEQILRTLGEPLEYSMGMAFPEYPPAVSVATYRYFHHANFTAGIRLFPGMKELLEELNNKGYKCGLLTSRLKTTANMALDHFGLRKYFQAIITCDDTKIHKPEPEPLFLVLDRLGSCPAESLMVGDTHFDTGCARNAGVPSVMVGWQTALPPEEMEAVCRPDHIIRRAEDLLEILSPTAS